MKKTLVFGLMLSLIAVFTLTSCKSKDDDSTPTTATPTTATITIMANGTLGSGTLIGGIDVTLALPAGVTVKADPDATNTAVMVTDTGVVNPSGAAAGANTLSTATYASGEVAIHVANPDGFVSGEFVTVKCDIAAGAAVTTTSFSVSGLYAVDLNGATITGLTGGYTASLQ